MRGMTSSGKRVAMARIAVTMGRATSPKRRARAVRSKTSQATETPQPRATVYSYRFERGACSTAIQRAISETVRATAVSAAKVVARRPRPAFGAPVAPERVTVPAEVWALRRRSERDALAV